MMAGLTHALNGWGGGFKGRGSEGAKGQGRLSVSALAFVYVCVCVCKYPLVVIWLFITQVKGTFLRLSKS